MISLYSFDIQIAKKYHSEAVNTIFNDIKSRQKTNNKIKHQLSSIVLAFIEEKRANLIIGEPDVLLDIHNEYLKLKISDDEKESVKVIFEYVYENYFQKKHGKEFLNKLNIDTCVYCNRNYTLDFKKLNNSRAQLDHWFPKDKFPILALSFYNLIPSCQSCNHIKSNKAPIGDWHDALENINHPYSKSEKFKFSWSFGNSLSNTKVNFKVEKGSKTEKTLDFNKTKEIYNAHSNKELRDLINLRMKYSKNYIEELFKFGLSKEEIYRMVFGIETKEEDYHKRPFSKFKHDIIEELKNIK